MSSNLGTLLSELRNDRKLSQYEVAQLSGLGKRTISHIESGAHPIRIETLKKLATILDPERVHWGKLLVAWTQAQLGDEAVHLKVAMRGSGAPGLEADEKMSVAKSKLERATSREVDLVISLLESPPLIDAVRGMMAHMEFSARNKHEQKQ